MPTQVPLACIMAVDDEASDIFTDLDFEKEIAKRANSPTALLIMKGISPIMVKDHFQISCSDVDGDGTLIFRIDDNPNLRVSVSVQCQYHQRPCMQL